LQAGHFSNRPTESHAAVAVPSVDFDVGGPHDDKVAPDLIVVESGGEGAVVGISKHLTSGWADRRRHEPWHTKGGLGIQDESLLARASSSSALVHDAHLIVPASDNDRVARFEETILNTSEGPWVSREAGSTIAEEFESLRNAHFIVSTFQIARGDRIG